MPSRGRQTERLLELVADTAVSVNGGSFERGFRAPSTGCGGGSFWVDIKQV